MLGRDGLKTGCVESLVLGFGRGGIHSSPTAAAGLSEAADDRIAMGSAGTEDFGGSPLKWNDDIMVAAKGSTGLSGTSPDSERVSLSTAVVVVVERGVGV